MKNNKINYFLLCILIFIIVRYLTPIRNKYGPKRNLKIEKLGYEDEKTERLQYKRCF